MIMNLACSQTHQGERCPFASLPDAPKGFGVAAVVLVVIVAGCFFSCLSPSFKFEIG